MSDFLKVAFSSHDYDNIFSKIYVIDAVFSGGCGTLPRYERGKSYIIEKLKLKNEFVELILTIEKMTSSTYLLLTKIANNF